MTLVVKTTFRTLPSFFLMFLFCIIRTGYTYFESQADIETFYLRIDEAFKLSYSFTWGEDISEWLVGFQNMFYIDIFVSLSWLLMANIVFFNLMIAVSGSEFEETLEYWEEGKMALKNELILYSERLYFWNWFNHKQGKRRKHIIYVEAD